MSDTVPGQSMQRSTGVLLAIATASLIAGCSTPPTPDVTNPAGLGQVKKIALITPAEPMLYDLYWRQDRMVPLEQLPKTNVTGNVTVVTFRNDVEKQKLSIGPELATDIAQELRDDGYQVTVISVPNPETGQFLPDVAALKNRPEIAGSDAVLDLVVPQAGYAHANRQPYRPAMRLDARLTETATGQILLQRTYYCADASAIRTKDKVVSCNNGYDFKNGRAILDDPARAVDGVRAALPVMAKVVADDIKR
ncbi:hypothetical protein ACFPL7_04165 [Dongia soli]|uniref:Pilus assembly protein CpaD n=1 Tax=Dongia soli TaxID=600628 RepID=A0ABU5EE69_9PROT|nr:hypothetical protein [Dongia soli]MDY0884513.1 hypothetical protein [Dongia soli]